VLGKPKSKTKPPQAKPASLLDQIRNPGKKLKAVSKGRQPSKTTQNFAGGIDEDLENYRKALCADDSDTDESDWDD